MTFRRIIKSRPERHNRNTNVSVCGYSRTMAGTTGRSTDAIEDQASVLPKIAVPGDGALIIQAALFYLEAAALAASLAVLAGCLAFAAVAWLIKLFGIEQSGDTAIDVTIVIVVGAATLATLVFVFFLYFQLLAKPVASHIVCALGSLMWALPVGILAPSLLKPIVPGYHMLVTWVLYLAVAGLIYFLKRRVVRL